MSQMLWLEWQSWDVNIPLVQEQQEVPRELLKRCQARHLSKQLRKALVKNKYLFLAHFDAHTPPHRTVLQV